MEKNDLIVVDAEDLEYVDDLLYFNNAPFSGIAIEKYENGKIREETIYKDGFQYGLSREWYPSGQIKWEFDWKKEGRYSKSTKWHMNGQLKSIANIELGIETDYTEWDESGNLLLSRTLDTNSLEYYRLLKNRERYLSKMKE